MLSTSKMFRKNVFIFNNFIRKKSNFTAKQKRKNILLPPIDNVSLCFVGNGAEGNSSSVFLSYNDKNFVFNCGEGTQRRMSDFG